MREAPRYCIALQDEPLRPVLIDCAIKVAEVITIALISLQPLIASCRLFLCDPGHHPNNERRHFARCRQTAHDPPYSPLLITDFPAIHSRPLAKVRAFVLCSFFSSLTDGLTLALRFRLQEARAAVVSSTAAATLR